MKTQFQKFQHFQQQKLSEELSFEKSKFQEQKYFAEELFEITERYIPTSYGKIFSITAGSPGQPLILVVHGSGPKNSSSQYLFLLHEYLVRISYLQKFYIVAIDCPGYGKSIGSKEAVKTFPRQMFEQILTSLNYKQYFAMFGHSQGGAAIFNAVYENPSLSQLLVMDRPVCGNIQRFRKFNIPTLLIYDIEDDGHPIWQGKLLFKELTYTEFYTYRNSQDNYWVPDNIWNKMLNFFSKYSNNRKGRTNIFTKFRAISFSPSVKERSVKKPIKNTKQKKIEEMQQNPSNMLRQKMKQSSKSKQKFQSVSLQKKQKSRSLDTRKQSIFQSQRSKIKQNIKIDDLEDVEQLQLQKEELLSIYSHSLSVSQKKKLSQIEIQMKEKEAQQLENQKVQLNSESSYQINEQVVIEDIKKVDTGLNPYTKLEQKKVLSKQKCKQKPKVQGQEQDKYKCPICLNSYYRPLQTNCNHIFCTKCLLEAMLVNTRCPLCRSNITKKTQKKQLHEEIIAKMSNNQIQKREKAYLQLKLMLESIVMIEIGNRSIQLQTKKSHFSKTKKKYMWQLFVKQKVNFKFEEVAFNVNMGDPYSKPVRVKNAPFVFESRGTFSFTCEISVKPRNKEYAPLTSVYRINIQPGTHTQVIAFKRKIYMKQ